MMCQELFDEMERIQDEMFDVNEQISKIVNYNTDEFRELCKKCLFMSARFRQLKTMSFEPGDRVLLRERIPGTVYAACEDWVYVHFDNEKFNIALNGLYTVYDIHLLSKV